MRHGPQLVHASSLDSDADRSPLPAVSNRACTVVNIRLIGDHSDYHCGSAAAFQAISQACRHAGRLVGDAEDFDILVVNGEGSMHHDSPSCLKKLAEVESAAKAGKRVFLINTVWQCNSQGSAEILRHCEQVVVREVLSKAELARLDLPCEVAIDQSYFLPIDPSGLAVDFEKRAVLTDFYSNDLKTFARITTQWTRSVPYIQMHEWEWSRLVRSLRTASVLLTGRHHAVYAACRARVPFLALKGNTHKIEGFIATSGVDVPVFESYPDLLAAYRRRAWRNYDYDALFDWAEEQQPWTLRVK